MQQPYERDLRHKACLLLCERYDFIGVKEKSVVVQTHGKL